jgi:hypothetical protein
MDWEYSKYEAPQNRKEGRHDADYGRNVTYTVDCFRASP